MTEEDQVEPQFLDFVIWSDATLYGGVCLRWNHEASELQWRPALGCSDEYWLLLPTPARVTWKAFWLLLDQAGVWGWELEYPPKSTAHTGWSLEVSFRGRNVRTSGGGLAYPNDTDEPGSPFEILCTALGMLAGAEMSELKPPHGWGMPREGDVPGESDVDKE